MNLRQKAKKYKQRCEKLEKMVIPTRKYIFPTEENRIVTLKAEQIVDTTLLGRMSDKEECYESYINKQLAAKLLHEILNYAKIERFPCCSNSDKEMIVATMKVLDMGK